MSELHLFSVTVTQTWSAEAEAFVLAENRLDAESAAQQEIEINLLDADLDDKEARGHVVSFDQATSLTKAKAADLWLILPHPYCPNTWESVEYDDFMQAFTPEALETARIAAIERNNGQLSLLEAAA